MSDSKHERDDRAEAVQALMLIREQCADVNAWQVWAANGDLVEAYPNELLDHITALTQRAEAAEAEREIERMRLAACGVAALGYFNGCEDVYKSASLEDVLKLRAEVEALRKDAARLCGALAGSWLYGDWKAETMNEREQEDVMRRLGWWPITEADLIAKRDAALAVQP